MEGGLFLIFDFFEVLAVLGGFVGGEDVFEVDVVGGFVFSPGEDAFEEGKPFRVFDEVEEVDFVFFFADAHVVEDFVVFGDS